jgi:hypothetical protein
MPTSTPRFAAYEESRSISNIVVDGSANEATVLTLSHWPGQAQPPGTISDTSAEMAFAHLDNPMDHAPAEVVTNNHFDQDGAVGLFALIDPSAALEHRALLVDLARAGDFGTYRYRDAARASMVLHAFADAERSPIAHRLTGEMAADAAMLYQAVLPELVELVTEPGRYEYLWEAEDEALSASEAAIAAGHVVLDDHPDLDLAIVVIDPAEPARVGHRFGHEQLGPIHPMAIHNATDCTRLLLIHGHDYRYVDRYETWVQVHTRTPPQRTDLRPLATTLTDAEPAGATWTATAPSALTPQLQHGGESALDADTVVALVHDHLRTAPTAWDPYERRT